MDYFIFQQLGGSSNIKHTVFDSISSTKEYFAYKEREVLEYAENIIESYGEQGNVYIDIVVKHFIFGLGLTK